MTPMKYQNVITLITGALASAAFAQTEITRTPEALLLGPADKPAATYRLVPPPNSGLPVEAGGYFHPLTTPRGAVVTDFVPPDHKHHRGVFLAWVEMHGAVDADFWGWGAHAPIKDRRIVNRGVVLEPAGGFTGTNEWLAGDAVVLVEKLTAVPRFSAEANVLDLTYRLTPTADTALARWAFSGFCVRFPKLGEVTIHNSAGVVNLPNPSHEKPETDWPAAPWYAATWKTADGAIAGVAVVDDAKNPPALWHNHRDVRMLNPAITAPAAVVLKANVETVLRYRVVAFDGEVPAALLDKLATADRPE
jgi:Methane oxygenase PmoA